jgi:hypothetical protein
MMVPVGTHGSSLQLHHVTEITWLMYTLLHNVLHSYTAAVPST